MTTTQSRTGRRSFDLAPPLQFIAAAPLTCLLSLAAIVISLWPGSGLVLQLDHSAVGAGEWWRLLTGHLTHWSGEHLFWDLLMFGLLGWICERRSRFAYTVCLVVAAVGISVGMLWTSSLSYRGLSGLATTSFALLAASLLREQIAAGNRGRTALLACLVAGLVSKIGYEFWSGQCILVSAAGSFTPQPLSHVLGALCGFIVGGITTKLLRSVSKPTPPNDGKSGTLHWMPKASSGMLGEPKGKDHHQEVMDAVVQNQCRVNRPSAGLQPGERYELENSVRRNTRT